MGPMKRALVISLSVAAGLGVVGLFVGKDVWNWAMASDEGVAVRMEPVAQQVLVETVSAPGIIEPVRKVDISAEVSARIMELPKRAGERVKTGELIMRLDDRDLKAALQSAEARRDGERYRLEAERARIVGTQNSRQPEDHRTAPGGALPHGRHQPPGLGRRRRARP